MALNVDRDGYLDRWISYQKIADPQCRGGACGSIAVGGKFCDACQAYLDLKDLYWKKVGERTEVLKDFQHLCIWFPDEMRELLTPIILDVVDKYLEEK